MREGRNLRVGLTEDLVYGLPPLIFVPVVPVESRPLRIAIPGVEAAERDAVGGVHPEAPDELHIRGANLLQECDDVLKRSYVLCRVGVAVDVNSPRIAAFVRLVPPPNIDGTTPAPCRLSPRLHV